MASASPHVCAGRVLFNSAIGLELDAENEFGGDCLDAVRNFSDLVHALLREEASSLSIAARHSRHWGEAKASLADLGVVRSFKSGARASLRSGCA